MECCKVCHRAYSCSPACKKEYEPFHKRWCKQNQFADAVEKDDPKFAEWMRAHGRQAVIRDDDVYRMQHKPVWDMDEMYGKAQFVPQVPDYSQSELDLMKQRKREEVEQKHQATPFEMAWKAIEIPEGLGAACDLYKWKQSLAFVYVFVRLPEKSAAQPRRKVVVLFKARQVTVLVNGDVYLQGEPFREIVPDESTWHIDSEAGVLEVTAMKLWRRDNYKTGETNAETWWARLFREDVDPHRASPEAVIPLDRAPTQYFSCPFSL